MGSQAIKPQYCLTDSIAFKANCPVSSTLESKIAILAKTNYPIINYPIEVKVIIAIDGY